MHRRERLAKPCLSAGNSTENATQSSDGDARGQGRGAVSPWQHRRRAVRFPPTYDFLGFARQQGVAKTNYDGNCCRRIEAQQSTRVEDKPWKSLRDAESLW
ncbi:hypothetical protein BHE74_00029994 [Ensete ventricosum]|nr:hypothetical protein GW17_00060103 [Ensete ventricosum]RWW62861.1 hypothetical protein BHE74_00029994 [Ensete ventricosum]